MRTPPHPMLLALALATSACGGGAAPAAVALPGDDVVLAEVDGRSITEYDLDRALVTTLGPLAEGVDAETRHDVLESLITSRAIAGAREVELTPEQRAALDREVEAHREQLLVRQYLAAHAPTADADDAELRAYYDAHPERFGAGTERAHELLVGTRELDGDERARVLEALGTAGARADWAVLAAELAARGMPIAHQRGTGDDALLHARLRQVIAALRVQRSSSVVFVDGRPFVARVTEERERSARPFAEVRDEIRRALGPRSVRDSIRSVREDVLARARVEYRNPSADAHE